MTTLSRHEWAGSDLVASCATGGVLLALCLAGAGEVRRNARLDEDLGTMQRFAEGMSAFAADSNGDIAGLSWQGGETYLSLDMDGNLVSVTEDDDVRAQARQAVHLMRLIGGRIGENGVSDNIDTWIASPRYHHLALLEFLGEDPLARWTASSADDIRQNWKDDPESKFDEGFWLPLQPGPGVVSRRWPYSTSFTPTAALWDRQQSNFEFDFPQLHRSRQGNAHFEFFQPQNIEFGMSFFDEVAFPANKVLLHDTHQRHFGERRPHFGLNEARVVMLMGDGAAAVRQSADSNPGWFPVFPGHACDFFYYAPFAWEEPTTNGEIAEQVRGNYRWTRGGLKGLDFDADPLDTGQPSPGDCTPYLAETKR